MDRDEIYKSLAERKLSPKDYQPEYIGDNGRINKCVELFKRNLIRTGGNLIDVGGGAGDLCIAVKDMFDNVLCVDISYDNVQAAHKRFKSLDLINHKLSALELDVDRRGLKPVRDDWADTVTALDFIEHIVDPENFARECHRVLKPSGEVFINTPNIRFWKHIQQLWYDGSFPHTSGDREVFHGGHLAFYTYKDLRMIFEPVGFSSVEQIKDEEHYENPPDWILNPLLGNIKNQDDYRKICLEFGCPNLLYKAIVNK